MFDFFKKKPKPETSVDFTPESLQSSNAESVINAAEVAREEIDAPEANIHGPSGASPGYDAKEQAKPSFTARLKQGLSKTRNLLGGQLNVLFGGGKIDAETYEELETILITSDIGVAATQKLLDNLKIRVKRENLDDTSALKSALKTELIDVLKPLEIRLYTDDHVPFVIMMVGVNGAGKTTTIGKLAKRFQAEGNTVLIAAGDTFRAAAREQ